MFSIEIPAITASVLTAALLIFVLRVVGMTLNTIRVLAMMRGRKLLAGTVGFFEALVYVIAIAQVVSNLENIWNILGYCLGFALGTMSGMWFDEKTAEGFANVRIVSRYKAQQIVDQIHDAGFGATVGWGHGRGGTVGMIVAVVRRKEIDRVIQIAETADPNAFVTIEDARTVRRGYMNLGLNET